MSTPNAVDICTRYAPSPTGLLHIGNIRTCLFAWLFARQSRGKFVLRIEDTDVERSDRSFEDLIYRDLKWFGIDWDEGPDVGGPHGPYRQSERFDIYRQNADSLLEKGLAFRCFCDELELKLAIESSKRLGLPWSYPGTCHDLGPEEVRRRIESGEQATTRLKVREGPISFDDIVHGVMQFSSDVISDPIILRSNGSPTYNYAAVVDDSLMGISHVIRGDDHLSNTPKQVLIYEALGRPIPSFAHLSTVFGPDQTRLSKRHGATSVAQFREAGYLPEALMNYVALLGWSPGAKGSEVVVPVRLITEFRLDRVNKNPAVFDTGKLKFLNRQYMKENPKTNLLVRESLAKAGKLPESSEDEWVQIVVDTLIGSFDLVEELPSIMDEVLEFSIEGVSDIEEVLGDDGAIKLIRLFREELEGVSSLNVEGFRGIVGKLKQSTGRKGRQLFQPLRVSLTGRSSGPELNKIIPLIDAGSRLKVPGVMGCRQRVEKFVSRYG